jgi:hypothetical protein
MGARDAFPILSLVYLCQRPSFKLCNKINIIPALLYRKVQEMHQVYKPVLSNLEVWTHDIENELTM